MTYRTHPTPYFGDLTNTQLVEAYNDLNPSEKPRKSPFASKDEGIARCQAAWKAWAKEFPESPEEKAARVAAVKEVKAKEREERKAAAEASRQEVARIKAERGDSATKKEKQARGPRLGLEATIKILAPQNPRRKGTISYHMFETMQKYPRLGDYLDHAIRHSKVAEEKRRRDASQWLANAVRDGHVEVVSA